MLHPNQILSANQSYDFVEPQSLLWRSWDRKTQRAPHRPRRGGNKAPMCVPRARTSSRLILERNSLTLTLTLTQTHTHSVSVHRPSFTHTHTQTYKTVAFLSSWLCAAFGPANRLLSLFQTRHPQVRSKAKHLLYRARGHFFVCSKLHSEFVCQYEACKNERRDSLCFLCHVFSFL